jgi:hypothetical protein
MFLQDECLLNGRWANAVQNCHNFRNKNIKYRSTSIKCGNIVNNTILCYNVIHTYVIVLVRARLRLGNVG